MQFSDYSTYFNQQENEWLSSNPKIKAELFEEIEDINNVNRLENGEPDLKPLEAAIKTVKLIIIVSEKNILQGPYDATHFQLIKSGFPEITFTEKNIWGYFSFLCACRRDEDITNKHRIYLAALTGIILQEELEDIDIQAMQPGTYNMNTNEIEYIKGEGVNAHFG